MADQKTIQDIYNYLEKRFSKGRAAPEDMYRMSKTLAESPYFSARMADNSKFLDTVSGSIHGNAIHLKNLTFKREYGPTINVSQKLDIFAGTGHSPLKYFWMKGPEKELADTRLSHYKAAKKFTNEAAGIQNRLIAEKVLNAPSLQQLQQNLLDFNEQFKAAEKAFQGGTSWRERWRGETRKVDAVGDYKRLKQVKDIIGKELGSIRVPGTAAGAGSPLLEALEKGVAKELPNYMELQPRDRRIQGLQDDLQSLIERSKPKLESLASKANAKYAEVVEQGFKVPGGKASATSHLEKITKGTERLSKAQGIKSLMTAVSDLNNIEAAVMKARQTAEQMGRSGAQAAAEVEAAAARATESASVSESLTKEESMAWRKGKEQAAEAASKAEKAAENGAEAVAEGAEKAAEGVAKEATTGEKAAGFFKNAEGGVRWPRVAMVGAATALGAYLLFGGRGQERENSHAARVGKQARDLGMSGQGAAQQM